MGKNTNIEWVARRILNEDGSITTIPGHTWNRWWGCQKIAPECQFCYAADFAKRVGRGNIWGPAVNTERWLLGDDNLRKPYVWNREAQAQGHRRNVFCSSMSDLFEENALLDEPRQQVWQIIENTPWLNWLLLTKRAGNILKMAPWGDRWPDNVWVGTSIGTQKRAEEEIDKLLAIPAIVRFLSIEPQIELVDLTRWLPYLQWIICGGESGPHARPFNLGWARFLRDMCLEAEVPFFFKQVGGLYHNSGGRLLDGRTWDQMPPEMPIVNTLWEGQGV